jgi:hypothetical protein
MNNTGVLMDSELVSAEAEIHDLQRLRVYRLQNFCHDRYRVATDAGITSASRNASIELYHHLCQKRHAAGNPSAR